MKIYGRESASGDFPCVKLENAKKKILQKIFFAHYEKTRNLYDNTPEPLRAAG